MAWNLAYYHLCGYVLRTKLPEFNQRWFVKFPAHHKNVQKSILSTDDFLEHLKESEVIIICRDASIITKDVWRILDEKLGKRNSAAHPSSIVVGQLQTDAYIVDLVENVVLKLELT